MIPIPDNQYNMLSGCYKAYDHLDKLNQFYPGSKPYKAKALFPERYPIGYYGSRIVNVDDIDVLKTCQILQKELPVFKGKYKDYRAQEWSSILPANFNKLSVLINVPPRPAGYHLSKFSDKNELDELQRSCIERVKKAMFPTDFIRKAEKSSYLRKDSSTGIPFHSSEIGAKLQSLELGYKVFWQLSKQQMKPFEFVRWLYKEYKLLLLFKIGSRGQIDPPEKERKDFSWQGTSVLQNKDIEQYSDYYSNIVNAAKTIYRNDNEFLEWIGANKCRRFRQIMIMPPIATILAIVMRVLISYRKTIFPHLRDQGTEYNIAALCSEGMKPKDQFVYDKDDFSFLGMDVTSFDRGWHSEIHYAAVSGFDSCIEPPFNNLVNFSLGAAAITQPMSRKDAFTPAFLTHDNTIDYGTMNVDSHHSGSPPTKVDNDFGSTVILEVICEKLGIGSFVEASANGKLGTAKFPISALVNGDDVLVLLKNKSMLEKYLKIVDGNTVGDWTLKVDKVPMFNNQKVVHDSNRRLYMIKNHEAIPEKVFKPEKPFGTHPSGARKLLPNLGYWLRKEEYNTPEGNEIFRIMNLVTKDVMGFTLDDMYKLTSDEIAIQKELMNNVEAVNIFSFLSNHERLMYKDNLDNIPEEMKSLYYFQILPEDFENIMSGKFNTFLKNFTNRASNKSEFEKRLLDVDRSSNRKFKPVAFDKEDNIILEDD